MRLYTYALFSGSLFPGHQSQPVTVAATKFGKLLNVSRSCSAKSTSGIIWNDDLAPSLRSLIVLYKQMNYPVISNLCTELFLY